MYKVKLAAAFAASVYIPRVTIQLLTPVDVRFGSRLVVAVVLYY
jgi:hypothetical protein